jgi:hypothetical protein
MKLAEQLRQGQLKVFFDNLSFNELEPIGELHLILKISGVWETKMGYGLTFKTYISPNLSA